MIRAKIYATETKGYSYDPAKEAEPDTPINEDEKINDVLFSEEGGELEIEYPNELFITVVSSNSQTAAGNYQIEYEYIDRDPEIVLASMSEEDRTLYFNKKIIIEEKEVTEDTRFWVIVVSGVLGLFLIICIICLFCKMRSKNKEIISEVEIMDGTGAMKSDNGVQKLDIDGVSPSRVDGQAKLKGDESQI